MKFSEMAWYPQKFREDNDSELNPTHQVSVSIQGNQEKGQH